MQYSTTRMRQESVNRDLEFHLFTDLNGVRLLFKVWPPVPTDSTLVTSELFFYEAVHTGIETDETVFEEIWRSEGTRTAAEEEEHRTLIRHLTRDCLFEDVTGNNVVVTQWNYPELYSAGTQERLFFMVDPDGIRKAIGISYRARDTLAFRPSFTASRVQSENLSR